MMKTIEDLQRVLSMWMPTTQDSLLLSLLLVQTAKFNLLYLVAKLYSRAFQRLSLCPIPLLIESATIKTISLFLPLSTLAFFFSLSYSLSLSLSLQRQCIMTWDKCGGSHFTYYTTHVAPNYKTIFLVEWGNHTH